MINMTHIIKGERKGNIETTQRFCLLKVHIKRFLYMGIYAKVIIYSTSNTQTFDRHRQKLDGLEEFDIVVWYER